MKILFLSDNGTEHMADHLFHGLVELFGNDSIIDYPLKEKYHVKELKDTGNAYLNWCQCLDPRENPPSYSEEQIVSMVNNNQIDLLITSIRAFDVFKRIKQQIKNIKTIVLNGEDDTDWSYKNVLLPNFGPYWNQIHMVIQREYKNNIPFERKVVPMWGPCPLRNFPDLPFNDNQEIDVFCHLGDTHPFRAKLRNKLSELCQKNGWRADIGADHYSLSEYFKRMNNSKICVHAGGMGWESTHYLNIPLAKSMLLAQPPSGCLNTNTLQPDPLVIPYDFKHDISAVFYSNDFHNMEYFLNKYINNEEKRREIVTNGYNNVINNLSSINLARYIMACINDLDCWRALV